MSVSGSPAPFPRGNRLLESLPRGAGPLPLEHSTLEAGQVLYVPGQQIRHVYFVESGLVSIVGANGIRRRLEVGMIGFEGMTSLEILLGGEMAAHEAQVQSAGTALRLTSAALREAVVRSPPLKDFFLRFVHAFMVQSTHAAIAAGRARINERLARILLMWQDRLREDRWLVTHDFLALLMGVRRPGVTLAIHELEAKGLVRSIRNSIRVLDRTGLEQAANGFYGAPEEEYDRLFPKDGGTMGLSSAA